MNDRIKKLRDQSLNAINKISAERAVLVTEFHKSELSQIVSVPVRRALNLKYILEHKPICINDGELIVGERGPAPKATPTYPEISLHTIEDLHMLNNREKVSYKVEEETFAIYKDVIIPFWQGKTNRDIIMEQLPQKWHLAYKAGIFTEFQEQRAPGHTVNGNKIYSFGMLDLIKQIDHQIDYIVSVYEKGIEEQLEELKAMKIAAQAIIIFAQRHADKLKDMAANEADSGRKTELLEMADVCSNVPARAPKNFHEALQYYRIKSMGFL
jgi:pyruvate-formate lyase